MWLLLPLNSHGVGGRGVFTEDSRVGWTVKFLPKEKANVFTLKVRQENELLLCPGRWRQRNADPFMVFLPAPEEQDKWFFKR